ncbi:MAG: hypothetical protein JGK17_31850 [Microcoleus sp. PH2017_10_PVI_O_A]|uniref:hypothetical protein n=1 Tax=Microcoleus sp. PH2017_10_PVI_O_A TaxID=2798821 RepID=UPI001DB24CE7|nr:hypothetical protein [Microcoleus sp. PH2017_10_PVI_O_A]MCC3410048.1 hypothetical protein [Microcoleus sp. PH2017_10_PVI_O_A]
MIKAIALGNNFLLTAIASSFLCWMASLHPNLLLFVQALFALKLIVSATGFVCGWRRRSSFPGKSPCTISCRVLPWRPALLAALKRGAVP